MTHRRLKTPWQKYCIWAVLSGPALILLWQYKSDVLTYGGIIHQSGLWSAALIALVLAVTPLRRLWPKARLSRFLLVHRRAIGVASFGYAALHTGVYLDRKIPLGKVLPEAGRLEILTGWAAFLIFLALAVTSNNRSVKRLGRRWQTLHRLVYVAAALTALHWALTSFDYWQAGGFFAFLIAIESVRLLRR